MYGDGSLPTRMVPSFGKAAAIITSIKAIPPNEPIVLRVHVSYLRGIFASQVNGGKGSGLWGGLLSGRHPVQRLSQLGKLFRMSWLTLMLSPKDLDCTGWLADFFSIPAGDRPSAKVGEGARA